MFQPHSTSAWFNCMTICHECIHHFKGTSQIVCTFCFLWPYLTHEEVYSSLRQSCADIKSNFSILSFCRWSYWTCTSSVLRRQTAIAAVPQMSPLTVNGGGFIHSKTPDQTSLSLSITLLITALQLILSTHFVPSCHPPLLWKHLNGTAVLVSSWWGRIGHIWIFGFRIWRILLLLWVPPSPHQLQSVSLSSLLLLDLFL